MSNDLKPLPGEFPVGIEATRSKHWFLELLVELDIARQVSYLAKSHAAEPRTLMHERQHAALLL